MLLVTLFPTNEKKIHTFKQHSVVCLVREWIRVFEQII